MEIKVLVVHPDGTQEIVMRTVEDEFWENAPLRVLTDGNPQTP
jgi:hypothetical protein